MELLKFMIELGGEQKALLAEEEDDQKCYTVNSAVFYSAIRLGRIAMLAELIKVRASLKMEFYANIVRQLVSESR